MATRLLQPPVAICAALAMSCSVFLITSTSIGIEARGASANHSIASSPPLLAAFSDPNSFEWHVFALVSFGLAFLGLMVRLLVAACRRWNCHCHCIARLRAYFAADQPMELQSPMLAAAVEPAPSPELLVDEAAWA
jgi:hypothetical protein